MRQTYQRTVGLSTEQLRLAHTRGHVAGTCRGNMQWQIRVLYTQGVMSQRQNYNMYTQWKWSGNKTLRHVPATRHPCELQPCDISIRWLWIKFVPKLLRRYMNNSFSQSKPDVRLVWSVYLILKSLKTIDCSFSKYRLHIDFQNTDRCPIQIASRHLHDTSTRCLPQASGAKTRCSSSNTSKCSSSDF